MLYLSSFIFLGNSNFVKRLKNKHRINRISNRTAMGLIGLVNAKFKEENWPI